MKNIILSQRLKLLDISRIHDDVIKWKHFPRYWPFVRGIHRSPGHRKDQSRGALMFSLICAWTNGWVNNREAGELRCHGAHYNVIVMLENNNGMTQAVRRIQFLRVIISLSCPQGRSKDRLWWVLKSRIGVIHRLFLIYWCHEYITDGPIDTSWPLCDPTDQLISHLER